VATFLIDIGLSFTFLRSAWRRQRSNLYITNRTGVLFCSYYSNRSKPGYRCSKACRTRYDHLRLALEFLRFAQVFRALFCFVNSLIKFKETQDKVCSNSKNQLSGIASALLSPCDPYHLLPQALIYSARDGLQDADGHGTLGSGHGDRAPVRGS
jgi:hypothetical protein